METDPASTNMLLLLFKMAVVWKEKKEKRRGGLQPQTGAVPGLGSAYIKQITTGSWRHSNSFARRTGERRWSGHTSAGTRSERFWNPGPRSTLEASISAPGALLRFHSTRRLINQHQSPVTFGMRDPKSLLCYRALCSLCFNASLASPRRDAPARAERMPRSTRRFPSRKRETGPVNWTLSRGCSRPLLRLRLHNPHNLCYAHATLHMFLWQGMVHDDHIGQDDLHGQLRHPTAALRQAGQACLPRIQFWLTFLQQFQAQLQTRYDRQQDAVEFLGFLLEYAQPPAYTGLWQSRYSFGPVTCVADSGHLYQPITLELNSNGLQASIEDWHLQTFPHALRQAPRMLFFQLKRWAQKDPRRPAQKDLTRYPFEVGAAIDLPLFARAQGLHVQWQRYRLVTILIHTGLSPWSGHYRSILSGFRQLPNGSSKWMAMLTDDGREVRICKEVGHAA